VPQWVLALSLFVHLMATAVWIGGLLATVLLVYPALRGTLANNPALYKLLTQLRKRFFPYSHLSLAALIVTGLFQMTANENYEGILTFNNAWSMIMLVKHIAIIGMALASLSLQFGVIPALERTALLVERGKGDDAEYAKLRRREVWLTWLNTILGIAVLAFSAMLGAL
jgi:putative copper export protein